MRKQAGRLRATALGLATTGFLVAGLLPSGLQPAGAVAPGPNGKIAFERVDGVDTDIFTVNPDGSGLANLTMAFASSDEAPAWSPDGTKIAFQSNRVGGVLQIFFMNADGSAPQQVTTTGPSTHPTWSPDGKKIAFSRGGEILSIDPAMGVASEVNLTNTGAPDADDFPDWSPDNRITFQRLAPADLDIFVMTSTGGSQTNITAAPAFDASADAHPNWSPDSSAITFDSDRDGVSLNIFRQPPVNGGAAQLTTDSAIDRFPTWSPDGTQIAFFSDRGTDGIHKMSASGEPPAATQVTTGSTDSDPSWGRVPAAPVPPPPPGTGQITVNPTSLNFGEVEVGTVSAPQTVTVSNPGPNDAFVKSVGITAGAPEYVVSNDTCSPKPFKLTPGATCAVSVVFQPQDLGPSPGNLQIVDQPINVALNGVGVEFEEEPGDGDGDEDGIGDGAGGAGGEGAGSGGGAGECGGGGGGFGGTTTGGGNGSSGSTGGSGGSSTSTSCANSEANAGEGGNADGGAGGNAQGAQGGAGGGNTNNNTPATNTCNGTITIACNLQPNVIQPAGNGGAGGAGGQAQGGNAGTANGGDARSGAESGSEASADGGSASNSNRGNGNHDDDDNHHKDKKKKNKKNKKSKKNRNRH
jgi:hypothetical protein